MCAPTTPIKSNKSNKPSAKSISSTLNDEVTTQLQTLASNSQCVSSLTIPQRLSLVNELRTTVQAQNWSHDWIKEEMKLVQRWNNDANGESDGSEGGLVASTRYLINSTLMIYLSTLKDSLEYQLSQETNKTTTSSTCTKTPEFMSKVRTEITNEGNVQVHGPFPILPGLGAMFEAWCQPTNNDVNGNSTDDDTSTNDETSNMEEGGVALVLAAGNASNLVLVDLLQNLFLHPRKPVLLKHHPLRPYLYKPFESILKPLIDRGYLEQVLDQGVEHTQGILKNELVQHVHMTGSYHTSQSIKHFLLQERKDIENVKSMVTSELGCSSPWIVSLGMYEDKELRSIAKMIAQAKKTNGGTFCMAAQVLILPSQWSQKDTLLSYIIEELSNKVTEPCYYPGSIDRCQSIIEHYRGLGKDRIIRDGATTASSLMKGENCASEVTIVRCGTFGKEGYDGKALTMEVFGPVLAVVELPHSQDNHNNIDEDEQEQYLLKTAIPFVNNKSNIFGSLSGVILTPQTLSKSTITKAVAAMKYGTVAVNIWSLFGYVAMLKGAVWCGHPRDGAGQSGDGFVGNMYDIKGMEKTVVYGPSLMKNPMVDDPPAIVMDVLNQIEVSKTKLNAFVNVCLLLTFRVFGNFLPSFLKPMVYEPVY